MRKHLLQGRYGVLVAVCAGLCAGAPNLFAQTELGIGDTVHHLDEIVVSAFKRPVPSTQLLRLQTPQAYLPMSVTGLVSEVWTKRGITHIQDAVKFLPGAHMRTVYGAYQRLEVRGFDVTPLMVDGVKDERFVPPGSSAPFPDFSSVESMELLKGPASVLHGQFATGGILNVVRKAPSQRRILNFRLLYGSYDNRQAMIDMGGALTHALRYRAVLNYADIEGYRRTNDRRMAGYLALAYDLGEYQALEFRGGFNRDKYGTDIGLAPVMSADVYNADGSLYLKKGESLPGLDRRARYNNESDLFRNSGANASLRYRYVGSEAFRLNEAFTFTYDMNDYFSTEPLTYLSSSSPIYNHYFDRTVGGKTTRTYISLDSLELSGPLKFGNRAYMYHNQLEANGRFRFGNGMKYEYLAGYSFVGYMRNSFSSTRAPRNDRFNNTYGVYGPGLYSVIDAHDPHSMGYIATHIKTANPSRLLVHALYLQNILELSEHFKLMLAGRYDHVRYQRTLKNMPVTDDSWSFKRTEPFATVDNSAFTYRAGLVYLPIQQLSIYGSYANFFQPFREYYSPKLIYVNSEGKRFDAEHTAQIFKPQTGYQGELGVKYTHGELFYVSAAVYHIKRRNERKTLATVEEGGESKTVVGQVGTTLSEGCEIEFGLNPLPELALAAGYTYTNARVSEIAKNDYLNIDGDEGRPLAYVPKNMFFAAGTYTFAQRSALNGLAVNFALSYTDKMYNNLSQDVELPSHFITDVGATYRIGKGISVSFNLNNVFDVEYALNTYGRQIVPCIGRNYTIALSYNLR